MVSRRKYSEACYISAISAIFLTSCAAEDEKRVNFNGRDLSITEIEEILKPTVFMFYSDKALEASLPHKEIWDTFTKLPDFDKSLINEICGGRFGSNSTFRDLFNEENLAKMKMTKALGDICHKISPVREERKGFSLDALGGN